MAERGSGLTRGICAALFASALVCSPARASDGASTRARAPSASAEARPAPTSYGTAVAIAYTVPLGVSVSGVIVSIAAESADPLVVSIFAVPVSLIGPPVTHWIHGNFLGGLGSLAGNATAFVVGGTLGVVIGPAACEHKDYNICAVRGGLLGAAALQGFWAMIDINELAWLPVERTASVPQRQGFQVVALDLQQPLALGATPDSSSPWGLRVWGIF